MAILFAFDEHKNRVAFDGKIVTPIAVPMQLPDGSIIFYDRGGQYGEYLLVDGEVERQVEGVDNGTYDNQNWRYLICDQADLDNRRREWGPYGTSEGLIGTTAVGYGLPNTEAMLAKYANNDSYWWKLIKKKRDNTGLNWFMPSLDELGMMYNNRNIITSEGGDAFKTDTYYWSSSEYSSTTAWIQDFSNGGLYRDLKNNTNHCRLLRRI